MSVNQVLILEDDPIIAADIASLLESEGYQISYVAHNATTAIDALSKYEVNFAILDIHLGGGLTGIDVAEIIHNSYQIPYIFLSSFDDEETLEEAQNHGPYGYLVKPFQDRSLLTTIKIAISTYQKTQNNENASEDIIESLLKQSFTTQEHKVIKGLLHGKSYKDIAEEIHISINTVKYHSKNIYNKCNLSGRSELTAKLIS